MKKVILCDDHCYHITDEDGEMLKVISPGLSRMVRDSESAEATHFVCERCGQVPPVKLRELHRCEAPSRQHSPRQAEG